MADSEGVEDDQRNTIVNQLRGALLTTAYSLVKNPELIAKSLKLFSESASTPLTLGIK